VLAEMARLLRFGGGALRRPHRSAAPRREGERVVAVADQALYAAKRSGRNGWVNIEAANSGTDGGAVGDFLKTPRIPGDAFGVLASRPPGALVWS
jgi:hypothetical protein